MLASHCNYIALSDKETWMLASHWFSEIRRLGCWPLIGSWRLEDFDAGLSFDLRDQETWMLALIGSQRYGDFDAGLKFDL